MIVSWFSGGVSSAIATKLALEKHGKVEIIYNHIDDQHSDTLRFLKDCEKWFGVPIRITQHSQYKSVDSVCRAMAFINSPWGAPCTRTLKKKVRAQWEQENPGQHTFVWGLDCQEGKRVLRIRKGMPSHLHEFPLIENNLTKESCHAIIELAGIKRPKLYDMKYANNNCIGCVKITNKSYWSKIKRDFPDVYISRCKLEEDIGATILFGTNLKDIKPGDFNKEEIYPECDMFCEIGSMKSIFKSESSELKPQG